ncbi:Gfo/Idh/MocA family oxidoreductase [Sphingomonas cannabina]|uniref:Gfo/Idh/MocA family protein n=1 Tax=Sphingomonas cannabina TaxID=2899123 RepID=UPI001F26AA96|nr:Gfo/Idh/MocA family oxidoreductase [Sphingomonas cannabina]UIJ47478.1 Gfo/Idh/MocA family oxidoreductase [Sphingomonas cannabina]
MLRGALIGCGFFAANQLHAWRDLEGVEIVAICDTDATRLAVTGDQFGIVRRYIDAAEMLAAEKLDFVDIATTPPSHRALVELAARHRLPVICQKPLAATYADAEAMVAACAAAGVPMMVHENFRWQAPIRALRTVIDEGRIGTPFFARFAFRSGFDVYAAQPYLAEGERFIIEDLGIHILDVARFVMGEAATLACRIQRVNPAIRGEDVATIMLGHAGGATSIVDCSYATPIHDELFPQTLIEVDGDRGRLKLEANYRLTIEDRDSLEVHDVAPPLLSWAERPWHGIQESVAAIQRHWVECLAAGCEPDTSGRDNLRTLALVDAAYRSAAEGRTIDVDPR